MQEDIPVDSLLLSEKAIGFDGLMHFYKYTYAREDLELAEAFIRYSSWPVRAAAPYVVPAARNLFDLLNGLDIYTGITATALGFYAPQGRKIRLDPAIDHFTDTLSLFRYGRFRITNFEMETSALYGLAALLGHRACTVCAIIANRKTGTFSKNPSRAIDRLIDLVLDNLTV